MRVAVLRPGVHSTLQDSGRHGFQHFGVPVGGAMDQFSHRVANLVAGNFTDAATIEMTLQGPQLSFPEDALIAICGADLSPRIGEEPVPEGKAVRVRAGSVLEFGICSTGCRAYLAINGGFEVPRVMEAAAPMNRPVSADSTDARSRGATSWIPAPRIRTSIPDSSTSWHVPARQRRFRNGR